MIEKRKSRSWARRDRESASAFSAFCTYYQLPLSERSLRKLAVKIGKNRTLVERWSVWHDWQARTRDWDIHMERIRRRQWNLQSKRALRASIARERSHDPS